MDSHLFHPHSTQPDPDFRMADRLNGCTLLLPCRFLEWSGWYSNSVQLRLLGHYRLYRLFRQNDAKYIRRDGDLITAYILQYRSGHGLKYFICRTISLIYGLGTLGRSYPAVEVATLNRTLLSDSPAVLYKFLANADLNFGEAYQEALEEIARPEFLYKPEINNHPVTETRYEVNIHQITTTPAPKGKERDVLSKWQMVVLFVMLVRACKIKSVDFQKPSQFEGFAVFLHGMTGKPKEAFLELFKKNREAKLFSFTKPGEKSEMINSLTNLADICRKGGLWPVVDAIETRKDALESEIY